MISSIITLNSNGLNESSCMVPPIIRIFVHECHNWYLNWNCRVFENKCKSNISIILRKTRNLNSTWLWYRIHTSGFDSRNDLNFSRILFPEFFFPPENLLPILNSRDQSGIIVFPRSMKMEIIVGLNETIMILLKKILLQIFWMEYPISNFSWNNCLFQTWWECVTIFAEAYISNDDYAVSQFEKKK